MLDQLDVFDGRVRARAFDMWQAAGCPEDAAEEFWHRAYAVELDELNLSPAQLEQVKKESSPIADAADFA